MPTPTPIPQRVIKVKVRRGDRPGVDGTTHVMALDGDLDTFFDSSYPVWQLIEFEFDAPVGLFGFRRYMAREGGDTSGNRGPEGGERISYSQNGFHWVELRDNTTRGWEDYTSDRPDTWHSVDYGWSPWLRMPEPVEARFVRFRWDDADDVINEIEFKWVYPADVKIPPPTPKSASTPASDSIVKVAVSGGNHPGENDTNHAMAFDGDLDTYFDSSYPVWQYVEFEFTRVVGLTGLRRYMTGDGSDASGHRGRDGGERVSYSLDGVQWKDVRDFETNGWEIYESDRPEVWQSVDYGWSPWLRTHTPLEARFVRFQWDDASDALNEVELDWVYPVP